jgi:hypothetical protein
MDENHSEGGYPINFGILSALIFDMRFSCGQGGVRLTGSCLDKVASVAFGKVRGGRER